MAALWTYLYMLLKLVGVGVHFANLGLPQSDIDSSRSAQRRRSQMNEQSLSDRPLQNPGTEVHFTLRHLPESPTECTVLCFSLKKCAVQWRLLHPPRADFATLRGRVLNLVNSIRMPCSRTAICRLTRCYKIEALDCLETLIFQVFPMIHMLYLLPLYIFIQSPAHFHCFPFEANLWFRRLLQHARTHQYSINSWCSMTMWHSTHIALKNQAAEFRCSRLQGLGNRCHLGLKDEERSFYCMVLFLHWLLVVLSSQPPDHVKHGSKQTFCWHAPSIFGREPRLIAVYMCT